jgi:hypothetical protein
MPPLPVPQAHPREEHLLPLMVVAGAAGQDVGQVNFNHPVMGAAVSGFVFGAEEQQTAGQQQQQAQVEL